jgi:hypothetical protein
MLLDTVFRQRARRQLAEFDQKPVATTQANVLRGLVRQGRSTRFGRDHDFDRIRTPADFRRLVPLRQAEQLRRDYWEPVFPHLGGATWPGPIPYLAVRDGQPALPTAYVPVSPALLAAYRAASWTALALIDHARPDVEPWTGRLLLLDSDPGSRLRRGVSTDRLAAGLTTPNFLLPSRSASRVRRAMTPALRASLIGELPPPGEDDDRLRALARLTWRLPVSCVAGPSRRLASFFSQVRRFTGADGLAEVWPHLAAVLYAGSPLDDARAPLAQAIGTPRVALLEACFYPEGALAIEDPRFGLPRLLTDHGVYFEFVPVEDLHRAEPPRHGAAEVELNTPYAVALTSPAGYWACLVGVHVCFESRTPPLMRLLPSGPAVPATVGEQGAQ